MLRNLRDAISSGVQRKEKYWQLVGRRTAVSYAEGVLTYRQAAESYSTDIAQRYIRPEIRSPHV